MRGGISRLSGRESPKSLGTGAFRHPGNIRFLDQYSNRCGGGNPGRHSRERFRPRGRHGPAWNREGKVVVHSRSNVETLERTALHAELDACPPIDAGEPRHPRGGRPRTRGCFSRRDATCRQIRSGLCRGGHGGWSGASVASCRGSQSTPHPPSRRCRGWGGIRG